ncbi:hypothetical protein GCM10010524_18250 [Streptomyces mexicanus]
MMAGRGLMLGDAAVAVVAGASCQDHGEGSGRQGSQEEADADPCLDQIAAAAQRVVS